MLRAASNHAELAFHGLAFVPPRADAPALVHAASLHRPAWMAFAVERFPAGAVTPIARDAPLVGALAATAEVALALQYLAFLHGSIADFLATARRALAELGPADVARPADLAVLKSAPPAPVELLRGAMALSARAFAAVHGELLLPFAGRLSEALTPRWEQLAARLAGLRALDVRVSAALGPRGRLIDAAVLVGSTSLPATGVPLDSDTPFALAAHEASVHAAGAVLRERALAAPWELIERIALDGAALAYRGTEVEEPYARWRLGIHESGLAPRSPATDRLADAVFHHLKG